MPKNKFYKQWLERARDDEQSIQILLKDESSPPRIICFHSQQMAEKLLKGFLVFKESEFPKVHDLKELESLIEPLESGVSNISTDLTLLDKYYIGSRYPADLPDFSMDEANEAFESARRVKKFVEDRVVE